MISVSRSRRSALVVPGGQGNRILLPRPRNSTWRQKGPSAFAQRRARRASPAADQRRATNALMPSRPEPGPRRVPFALGPGIESALDIPRIDANLPEDAFI